MKNSSVYAILWAVTFIVVASFNNRIVAAPLSKPLSQRPACQLNYGYSPVPPFIIEQSPEPIGYQIDFVRWVAQDMGCQIHFHKMDWQASLKAIESGQLDVIGRASLTPERQEFGYFSAAYHNELMVLILLDGEGQKYQQKDIAKLLQQGFTLGVIGGAYYGPLMAQLQADPQLSKQFVYFDFAAELPGGLEKGLIDGFFEAPFIMDMENAKTPDTRRFEEYPLEIITGQIHFLFSQKTINPAFIDRFNQSILKVKQSEAFRNHPYWSNAN